MLTLLALVSCVQFSQAAGIDPSESRLPLAFLANQGQWQEEIRFRADSGPLTIGCEAGALHLLLEGGGDLAASLRLVLTEDGAYPGPSGQSARAEYRHYFSGNQAAAGSRVSAFAGIRYAELRAGVSLQLREAGGRVEYDLLLAPGAEASAFSIRCEGADSLRIDADGALVIETAAGPLRQTPPRTWQIAEDGRELPVPSKFRVLGSDRFGFEVQLQDPVLPTVVDPGLDWSTFLGGSVAELIEDVARTSQGEWVVGGWTRSPDFPTTAGAYRTSAYAQMDQFVGKFSADGSQLLWATYVGGSGDDDLYALRLDSADRPVILGYTESSDFPTTAGAFDRVLSGGDDAVVYRLASNGSALEWSTFLGGQFFDELQGMTLTAANEPVVVGGTESPDYPIVGSAARPMSGYPGYDAVISRLSADGTQLLMSTCAFGIAHPGREDFFGHVALLPGGATVVVAGDTTDPDFPVTPGSVQTVYGGNQDGVLAVVDLATAALPIATFLGGSGEDNPHGLAVDSNGKVVIVTTTDSPDFPTPALGYDLVYSDRGDLAVTVLSGALAGSSPGIPLAGTFLGTDRDEEEGQLAIAPDGTIYVAGSTNHPGFPVTPGAWDTVHNGAAMTDDVFVSRFDASLTTLLYSTFLGGTGMDLPRALATVGNDAVVVAGVTTSVNFPTRAGSYDTGFNGFLDGFLARLDTRPCPILQILPDPLVRGQSATIRVTELTLGERAFVLYGTSGIGFGAAAGPLGGLNLDLLGQVSLISQTGPANASGAGTLVLTIPPSVPLSQVWFQAAVKRGVNGSHSLKSNVVARLIQ